MPPSNGGRKRKSRSDSESSSGGSISSSASSSSSSSSDGSASSGDESERNDQKRNQHQEKLNSKSKTPSKPPKENAKRQIIDPPGFPPLEEAINGDSRNGSLNSSRYELWSIRLPAGMHMEDLDGCEFKAPTNASAGLPGSSIQTGGKAVSIKSSKGGNFSLRWGHHVENESYRVLIRGNGDSNFHKPEDDDSDNPKRYMIPANTNFQRHINVVDYVEEMPDTKLAPGIHAAPPLKLGEHKMRKAYQHVPQRSGLKRRWMPPGTQGAAELVHEASRPRSMSASSLLLSGGISRNQKARQGKVGNSGDVVSLSESRQPKTNGAILIDNAQRKNHVERATLPQNDGTSPVLAAIKAEPSSANKKETKEEKRARKEQKKARKEAKKSKKEEKKAKKEKRHKAKQEQE